MNEIGNNLRQLRKARGLSLNDVSHLYNRKYKRHISSGYISDLEHGSGFSVSTLLRISSILNIDAGEILKGTSLSSIPNSLLLVLEESALSELLKEVKRRRIRPNDVLYFIFDISENGLIGPINMPELALAWSKGLYNKKELAQYKPTMSYIIIRQGRQLPLEKFYFKDGKLFISVDDHRTGVSSLLTEIHEVIKQRFASQLKDGYILIRT